jgi:hypothetical protein
LALRAKHARIFLNVLTLELFGNLRFRTTSPENIEEFAAMCGEFSGTWERTARFLNKSM